MLHRNRIPFLVILVSLGFLAVDARADAQPDVKGLRVYSAGHSFHFFMPGILPDIAKKAKIDGHAHSLSAIGGSRVYQHWTAQTVVTKDSDGAVLPVETIHVASTARFAPAGELTIKTSEGDTVVTYSGMKEIEREKKTPKDGDKAKKPAKEKLFTFTGCKGGKGSLATGAKVTQEENAIRQALKAGKIDVLTMSPIYLPDDGIENFVKLAIGANPKIRIYVQENWLPWDHYDPAFKGPKGKIDHNAPSADALRKMHEPYFKSLDEHVAELNAKHKTHAVRVAPVGQAVVALRTKIIAGDAPGLKEQNDLFTDAIGHAKAPLATLVSYVYFSLVYERSPVGLPMPAALGKATEQSEKLNRLLQEIAWHAVTSHPQSGVKSTAK